MKKKVRRKSRSAFGELKGGDNVSILLRGGKEELIGPAEGERLLCGIGQR